MSDTMLDAGDQRKNKPHHLQGAQSSGGGIPVCSVMYWCYHGAGRGGFKGVENKGPICRLL